ncbi:unnamed protein product [Porites evermanni]|uniref:F-box domain-containing protein n=1 Tax=Porites evermanni TaxID=104178 RepID=A0ABN8SS35_9CNID|nr:unnamed protein product [Porites evermanni]
MSQHQKHLSSYLKSRRSVASNSGPSKERKNVVEAKPSKKSTGKVLTLLKTKAVDLRRLPDELLLKIFRYLSPSELLVCAQVCHQWTIITKESLLWKPLLFKLPKQVRDSLTFEETKGEGFDWKSEIIKRSINARNKEILGLRKKRKKSPYTGLPNEAPQSSKPYLLGDVRWKLCVTDTSGKEHWLPAGSSKLFASSLCIRWYSLQLPPLARLKVLQVFAFLPVFYHRNWTPNENSACARSLVLQEDLRNSRGAMMSLGTAISEGGLITAHVISPSILAACWSASWKDGGELAFITVCLHHHNLTEKILFGSHDRFASPSGSLKNPSARDSPGFFFVFYLSTFAFKGGNFIHCQRDTLPQFSPPRAFNLCGPHWPLVCPCSLVNAQKLGQDICFLDVTVLHEGKLPFWCMSVPVRVFSNKSHDGDFSSEGEKLFIEYSDEHGIIRIDLLKIENEGQTFVTNVELRLLKSFVNFWFHTSY